MTPNSSGLNSKPGSDLLSSKTGNHWQLTSTLCVLISLRPTEAQITRIQHRALYSSTRQLTSPLVRSHPSKLAPDAVSSLQQIKQLATHSQLAEPKLGAAHSIHSCTARSTDQITHTGQLARTQQISSKLELRKAFVLPDGYMYPLSKLKTTTALVYAGRHPQPRLKLVPQRSTASAIYKPSSGHPKASLNYSLLCCYLQNPSSQYLEQLGLPQLRSRRPAQVALIHNSSQPSGRRLLFISDHTNIIVLQFALLSLGFS
ncbi:protein Z [Dorcoceras hygrometricum]|uniref:Protein Z n=1 Tax=Dorcoceras hygrometricum TaxID=472368 RepID=A0A2Z7DAP3_9LAMI|nr:protein Z [Dorcoceras hygrometricum]